MSTKEMVWLPSCKRRRLNVSDAAQNHRWNLECTREEFATAARRAEAEALRQKDHEIQGLREELAQQGLPPRPGEDGLVGFLRRMNADMVSSLSSSNRSHERELADVMREHEEEMRVVRRGLKRSNREITMPSDTRGAGRGHDQRSQRRSSAGLSVAPPSRS